ncbi:MAG: carbohydrate ABC transporter substrate-binding protein [Oscillospiraceae bacterium]|nr:carbohydrate ABC transporter substrate-binding protein [Oscillospiraceae bacterium]
MKHRKITAVLLAVVMVLPVLTGCGRQKEHENNTDETRETDEIIIDEDGKIVGDILANSYRTEEILKGEYWMTSTAIGNLLLFTEQDPMQNVYKLMSYDPQTEERKDFSPKCFAETNASNDFNADFFPLPDGKIGLVCTEFHDEKAQREIIRRCVEIYDGDLNYVETKEIPESFAPGQLLNPGKICVDAQGNWYCMIGTDKGYILESYNSNYEKYGEIALPADVTMQYLFNGGDGSVFICCINKTDSGNYHEVFVLDAEARTGRNIGKTIVTRGKDPAFVTGTMGYDFYYHDDYGIYGVKGSEVESIVSWINSDLPVGHVMNCCPLENGTFLLNAMDPATYMGQYRLAEKRSQEELENVQLITLSTVGMYNKLEGAVIEYNRADKGSRIIVQDYADYNTYEDSTLGLKRLREDLLDGVVADIVCTDGLNFESLAGKGLFADWYDLMAQDAEFSRDDYLKNFFESYEYDGKLQRLGVSFIVLTAAAKSEHAGTQQGCTMEELMALADSMPQEMKFSTFKDRDAMISHWFEKGQNSFVNRVKSECYFGSSDVVKLLEMLRQLPDKLSPEDFTKDEWDRINADDPYIYADDRALIDFQSFSQPMDYYAMLRTTFGDAPVTLLGIPMQTDEGNGGVFDTKFTLSVNAQSEKKDAVWSFMKHLLSEKYQMKLNDSMPIHRGVLEQKLDLATRQVTAQVTFDGIDVNIGAATQESMDTLYSYIQGIRTCYYYDPTVYRIMKEETEMFLSGDQTAENAAKMMQSRVSIYLSEQS